MRGQFTTWRQTDLGHFSKRIPLEMAGSVPLDMSTYELLFGTCRIPGQKRDRLRYGRDNEAAKHIAVVRNGHVRHISLKLITHGLLLQLKQPMGY